MDTKRIRVAEGHKIHFQGRDHVAGETLVIPEKEARLQIKLGRAVDATSDTPPLRVAEPRPAVTTRDLLSEGSTEEGRRGRGRRYNRSDLRAED